MTPLHFLTLAPAAPDAAAKEAELNALLASGYQIASQTDVGSGAILFRITPPPSDSAAEAPTLAAEETPLHDPLDDIPIARTLRSRRSVLLVIGALSVLRILAAFEFEPFRSEEQAYVTLAPDLLLLLAMLVGLFRFRRNVALDSLPGTASRHPSDRIVWSLMLGLGLLNLAMGLLVLYAETNGWGRLQDETQWLIPLFGLALLQLYLASATWWRSARTYHPRTSIAGEARPEMLITFSPLGEDAAEKEARLNELLGQGMEVTEERALPPSSVLLRLAWPQAKERVSRFGLAGSVARRLSLPSIPYPARLTGAGRWLVVFIVATLFQGIVAYSGMLFVEEEGGAEIGRIGGMLIAGYFLGGVLLHKAGKLFREEEAPTQARSSWAWGAWALVATMQVLAAFQYNRVSESSYDFFIGDLSHVMIVISITVLFVFVSMWYLVKGLRHG